MVKKGEKLRQLIYHRPRNQEEEQQKQQSRDMFSLLSPQLFIHSNELHRTTPNKSFCLL